MGSGAMNVPVEANMVPRGRTSDNIGRWCAYQVGVSGSGLDSQSGPDPGGQK